MKHYCSHAEESVFGMSIFKERNGLGDRAKSPVPWSIAAGFVDQWVRLIIHVRLSD